MFGSFHLLLNVVVSINAVSCISVFLQPKELASHYRNPQKAIFLRKSFFSSNAHIHKTIFSDSKQYSKRSVLINALGVITLSSERADKVNKLNSLCKFGYVRHGPSLTYFQSSKPFTKQRKTHADRNTCFIKTIFSTSLSNNLSYEGMLSPNNLIITRIFQINGFPCRKSLQVS